MTAYLPESNQFAKSVLENDPNMFDDFNFSDSDRIYIESQPKKLKLRQGSGIHHRKINNILKRLLKSKPRRY